jgi:CRP-like cAMP-binding protein
MWVARIGTDPFSCPVFPFRISSFPDYYASSLHEVAHGNFERNSPPISNAPGPAPGGNSKEVLMIEPSTLTQFAFFADLPDGTLSNIAATSQVVSFETARVIFRSGDKAETLYGVMEGEVELSLEILEKARYSQVEFEEAVHRRVTEKASQITVDTARPGHVFGWSALTGRPFRTVTATCSAPTKVVAVSAHDIGVMCHTDHGLGFMLMKRLVAIISNRLDNRNKRLIELWAEAYGVPKVSA